MPPPNEERLIWRLNLQSQPLDVRINLRDILHRLLNHPSVESIRTESGVAIIEFQRGVNNFYESDFVGADQLWSCRERSEPSSTINRNGDSLPELTSERILEVFRQIERQPLRSFSSWINPLRSRIDYQSIARQTFLVEELPQGALPVYFNPCGEIPLLQETEPEPEPEIFRRSRFERFEVEMDFQSIEIRNYREEDYSTPVLTMKTVTPTLGGELASSLCLITTLSESTQTEVFVAMPRFRRSDPLE